MAKGDMVVMEGKFGGRELRSVVHPLDYHLSRGRIEHHEWFAGMRFGELWYIGYMRANLTQVRYCDPLDRGKHDPHFPDHCRDEYDRACLHLKDMKVREVTFKVCCLGEAAGEGKAELMIEGLRAIDKFFHRYSRST